MFFKRKERRTGQVPLVTSGTTAEPDIGAKDPKWSKPFETLRGKWSEVPTDSHRIDTRALMKLDDDALIQKWTAIRDSAISGANFCVRGWYHELYRPLISGSKMLEIGTGMGLDGLTFAPLAGSYTFVDISQNNLALLERLTKLLSIKNATFIFLQDLDSLEVLQSDYDVILASGSLHHAPYDLIHKEIQRLAARLKVGGRWLQLAYPKERWIKEGAVPFHEWGKGTDGNATPWAEWYDVNKLSTHFIPFSFEPVLSFNFHNDDFNWFDFVKRDDKVPCLP